MYCYQTISKTKILITKDDYVVKSNEIVKVTGYYEYVRNADISEIPCMPEKGEGVGLFTKGKSAPVIKSCGHLAMWRLVHEKLS